MTLTAVNTTNARQLDVKETAAHLRGTLRKEFPGVKFSVRMSRGSAYGWFSVTWDDGPTCRAVQAVTDRYESRRFDGMDDGYHSTGNILVLASGEVVRPDCCGVTSQRNLTPAAYRYASEVTGIDEDDACTIPEGYVVAAAGHPRVVIDYPNRSHRDALYMWLQQIDLTGRI